MVGQVGWRTWPGNLGLVVIDEGRIQELCDEVVRLAVEQTLNALLDAKVGRLCVFQVLRAQRSPRGYVAREP